MKKIVSILSVIIVAVVCFFLITKGLTSCENHPTKEEQNAMSKKDSSYSQIKTKEEVKKELGDSDLGKNFKEIDKKENIITITKTVVKYVHDTTLLTRTVYVKTDTSLMFNGVFNDSITKLEVSSHVKWKYDSLVKKVNVDTAFTKLNNVEMKFGIGLIKSIDEKGFYRVRSNAYYLKPDGELGDIIPKNKLNLKSNEIIIESNKPKSNWAITLSPFSMGYFLTPSGFVFGVGPNIGISYRLFGW